MKRLIAISKILATTLAMTILAPTASAKLGGDENVRYSGDLAYKYFCEAIVKDDVKMLKRSVRSKVGSVANSAQGVLKKLTAADGMACNGVDLATFSEQRNSSQVSKYLSKVK